MLRTITLSVLMLISVLAMLPYASSTAHGIRQSVSSGRHYRRHSRAWWRRYRAHLRRKHEAALAAHRNGLLGPALPQLFSMNDPLLAQLPAILGTETNAADMKPGVDKASPPVPGRFHFQWLLSAGPLQLSSLRANKAECWRAPTLPTCAA